MRIYWPDSLGLDFRPGSIAVLVVMLMIFALMTSLALIITSKNLANVGCFLLHSLIWTRGKMNTLLTNDRIAFLSQQGTVRSPFYTSTTDSWLMDPG